MRIRSFFAVVFLLLSELFSVRALYLLGRRSPHHRRGSMTRVSASESEDPARCQAELEGVQGFCCSIVRASHLLGRWFQTGV